MDHRDNNTELLKLKIILRNPNCSKHSTKMEVMRIC